MPRPPPALTSQDWSLVSRQLTRYTFLRLGKTSWDTAEEIAQEAITQLLDPAYAGWDRERYPDVLDCLGSIVNGLVQNHRKKKANSAKHVPYREDDRTHDDEVPDLDAQRAALGLEEEVATYAPTNAVLLKDARTAEDLLAAPSPEHAALDAIRLRLHGDALALAILDHIQAGLGSPAAQARALGVPVGDVYSAKRRIHHHTRQIAKNLNDENGARS